MRGGLTAAVPARVRARDPLQTAVDARLGARLDTTSAAPLALGLSGGGDSLALLGLVADWCARMGRPLLALTVDHGLSAESAAWTARAGRMAADVGASWRPLAWAGPKPSVGLPAAARAQRHARLAQAARQAGARVVLLAHTADDHAETEALRGGDAPAIGRLREWAPSPAWPEGRGVFLLRLLLGVSRAELRARLVGRGLDWVDDPANLDHRFARARLRAQGVGRSPPAQDPLAGFGEALADGRVILPRRRLVRGAPDALRSLAAALACAAGAPGPPRGRPLADLLDRLADGDPTSSTTASSATPVIATLNGARVQALDGEVVVGRDLGREPPAEVALRPGEPEVWDGRFEAVASEPGWSVGAADGRLSRLPPAERLALSSLPPALRRAHPVFLRDRHIRLQPEGADLRALAPARFDAAIGRIATECALRATVTP